MSLNILVVDDSETVRNIITKTLGMTDLPVHEVHTASNGQEGLEVMRAQWIDLVLCDINMPVMNGVEMIEQMGADDELKAIPVIIISTEGSATRIDDLKTKGVSAYIRKPFTPEQVREVIAEVLGEQHAD